jgi:hypothetical protein
MRLDNHKKVEVIYQGISIVALIGIFGSFLFIFFGIIILGISNWLYLAGFILIFLLARFYFSHSFQYDSDGEALNFRNDKVHLFGIFKSSPKKAEFPKRKLKNYRVKHKFVGKYLSLTLYSSRAESGQTKLEFDISLLSGSEIKELKRSLNKIVSLNKNQQTENQGS